MKKILCILLSLLLCAALAACNTEPATTQPSGDAQDTTGSTETQAAAPEQKDEAGFVFTLQQTQLTPGAVFDPDALDAPASTYEVPSCALAGMDQVYNYDTVEVTAYNDGTNAIIYSIYLIDPNTSTDEGLFQGDSRADVEALYGTDYTEVDLEMIYTRGETELRILLEDDVVVSIEYRLIVQ